MKVLPADITFGLTISRLRALTAVAEEGTYAAAARRLSLSHSAIAQQIREMEAAFGLRLFDRAQGRLIPTPVGQELCEIGERVLDAEREAARVVARRDMAGRARLRVGLGNSMPGMEIIASVMAAHGGLSVNLRSGSHSEILAAVLRRDVDVGVLPDVPGDTRFRRLAVLRQEVVAIVSPSSAFAGQPRVSLPSLAETALIFRSRGSSTQRVVDRAFRLAGLAPDPRLVADTRDAVFEAVAAGVGVGFMWRYGSHRNDLVRRITVDGMGAPVEETVFALTDERNPLVDLFFHAAERFSRMSFQPL